MANDDKPRDQSSKRVNIDEDKIYKGDGGNEALLDPASSARKHLAKTSRNQPVRVKRSISSASGQGSTKRL